MRGLGIFPQDLTDLAPGFRASWLPPTRMPSIRACFAYLLCWPCVPRRLCIHHESIARWNFGAAVGASPPLEVGLSGALTSSRQTYIGDDSRFVLRMWLSSALSVGS